MNKVGVNNLNELEKIEKTIVKAKLETLSIYMSFNEESIHTFSYLNKLHKFLFSDTKSFEELNYRPSNEEIFEINEILNENKEACEIGETKKVFENLKNLYEMQIFPDGNTRTIFGYSKILSEAYNIDLDLFNIKKRV